MASTSIKDYDSEPDPESKSGIEFNAIEWNSKSEREPSESESEPSKNRVSSHSNDEKELMDLRLIIDVAIKGDVDGLKQALQDRDPGILQQAMTPLGDTLLHLAAKLGHEKLLLEICDRCPSLITKRNRSGNNPLHVAARAGHLAVVHHLIDKMTSSSSAYGTTAGAVSLLGSQNHQKGDTALHEALRYCRHDVAKLLIQNDPHLCCLVNKADESPFFLAVSKGYSDVVDQILRSSPSPACGGPEGWAALHASTILNNEIVGSSMTEKLLQLKPELARVKDNHGGTPLHYAFRTKKAEIVRLLFQHDASLVYIQDKAGLSPLHVAARWSDLELLKMTNFAKNIIQYCPDLEHLVDNRGHNVLHELMARMDTDIEEPSISELLKIFGLEVLLNQPNNYGNTPLHLATIWRKEHFVHFLAKDSRVDKKARNNHNCTAYDIACIEYNRSLKEKDKNHLRCMWARIKSDVDPYDQYFLCDKPPDVEQIVKEDVENQVHEKDAITKKIVMRLRQMWCWQC